MILSHDEHLIENEIDEFIDTQLKLLSLMYLTKPEPHCSYILILYILGQFEMSLIPIYLYFHQIKLFFINVRTCG